MYRLMFKMVSCLIIASLIVMPFFNRQLWMHASKPQLNHPTDFQKARDLSHVQIRKILRVKQHSLPTMPNSPLRRRPKTGGRKAVLKTKNRNVKTNYERFFIYTCNNTMDCCGLGGRLKGMVTSYLFAKALNRTFGIESTKPCNLRKFLQPNLINWDINSSKLNNRSIEFLDMYRTPAKERRVLVRKKLTRHLTADVVKFHTNQNYIPILFKNPRVAHTSSEFVGMPINQVYKTMISNLFLPSDEIQSELNSYLMTYVNKLKLVCAHIRIGQNPTIPNEKKVYMRNVTATLDKIWRFFDKYNNTDRFRFYIATDAEHVKDTAKNRYASQFKDTSGPIGHVDKLDNSEDGCNILHKAVLEQLLLAKCDVLLLTPSGYGIIAAFLRNTNTDLFCLRDGNTEPMPCQMETLPSNLGRF